MMIKKIMMPIMMNKMIMMFQMMIILQMMIIQMMMMMTHVGQLGKSGWV